MVGADLLAALGTGFEVASAKGHGRRVSGAVMGVVGTENVGWVVMARAARCLLPRKPERFGVLFATHGRAGFAPVFLFGGQPVQSVGMGWLAAAVAVHSVLQTQHFATEVTEREVTSTSDTLTY